MREPLDVGAVIEGRYELVEELGEGGFARVFAARQVHLDRLVAIKVLNVSLHSQNDDSFEKRFLHEAKMAAQVSHPNVVTIHEFGFSGPLKQPYIAMEMLQGHDLDHELYDGPMLPSRALRLLLPALDALAAGHALQIVHKDLKPANLFISSPGLSSELMVVLDYGVARWNLDSSPKFTATGAFTGTPAYMAPEYAREQVVTPAVDVYQIGLILPEMLTGLPLVMEETPWDCLMVHAEGKVEIPDVVRTSPIGPIVEQALAYDYRDRLPDASALRAALEQVDPQALDDHFREQGLGTVEAMDMGATLPPRDEALSDETHRTFTGKTNAAWPPAPTAAGSPSEAPESTSAGRAEASPGTVLVPPPGKDPGGRPAPQREEPGAEAAETQFVDPADLGIEPERGRHRTTWGVVAAIAVGLVGATVALLLFVDSSDRSEPPADPPNVEHLPERSAWISSEPGKAVIERDGEVVGKTPQEVAFEEEKVTLRVRLDGYEPQEVTVRDGDAPTVVLEPIPAAVAEKVGAKGDSDERADAETRTPPEKKPKKPVKSKKPKRSDSDETKDEQPTSGFQIAD